MSDPGRAAALEAIADEITACTRCRLHAGRTRAVPGEGSPDTEVVFVGEGPGYNEDRQGRPFVGRAGDLLVRLLATIGWRREHVFITNIVKCRPPDNRDPEPDEIAACEPYLRRQLEALDPALVVTLGRHSMGRFMPGARISQIHGTRREVDPATGARSALAYAMFHPAAALRSPEVERQSFDDAAGIPAALLASRARREAAAVAPPGPDEAPETDGAPADVEPAEPGDRAPALVAAGGPAIEAEAIPASAADPGDPADQLALF